MPVKIQQTTIGESKGAAKETFVWPKQFALPIPLHPGPINRLAGYALRTLENEFIPTWWQAKGKMDSPHNELSTYLAVHEGLIDPFNSKKRPELYKLLVLLRTPLWPKPLEENGFERIIGDMREGIGPANQGTQDYICLRGGQPPEMMYAIKEEDLSKATFKLLTDAGENAKSETVSMEDAIPPLMIDDYCRQLKQRLEKAQDNPRLFLKMRAVATGFIVAALADGEPQYVKRMLSILPEDDLIRKELAELEIS